jgi:hypothetical protein
MASRYPEEEESEESREGTASHWLGETLIQMATAMHVTPSIRDDLIGIAAPNGITVSDEMFDAAWMYADDVVREIKQRPGASYGVEHRITAPQIHAESFGTCDTWLLDRNEALLIIWDYKYGRRGVEAFENWQAINYAAGLFNELGIDGNEDQYLTVDIRIVQPRYFHRDGPVRSWQVRAADLRGHITTLSNNAHIALSDRAECRSGEHCRNCSARHACTAALDAGLGMYEAVSRPVPSELSPQALGTQLALIKRARKQLEYLEAGYEEQVENIIRSGNRVPGWVSETSYGRLSWAKPADEVFQLGELMGIDLRKPEEPITPTQAKSKGIDAEVVHAYSEKIKHGFKIVPDNINKAREVFTK